MPSETAQTQAGRENRPYLPPEKTPARLEPHDRDAERLITGGTAAEGVAGVLTIVVAIAGLVGAPANYAFTIGAVVLGIGLVIAAGTLASKYLNLLQGPGGEELAGSELRGGVGAGFIGGVAAIILGVLGWLGLLPTILTAVAIMVAGASMVVGTMATVRLNRLIIRRLVTRQNVRFFAHELISTGAGMQSLAGAAGIALGIISLVSSMSATLLLIGLVCMGASLLLSGSALSVRMLARARG